MPGRGQAGFLLTELQRSGTVSEMSSNPYETPAASPTPERGRPPRSALVLALSLAVMLPWPLLALGMMYRRFDYPGEFVLLFGGVTGLFLTPILLIARVPGVVFGGILLAAWLAAWIAPAPWVIRRRTPAFFRKLLIFQSAFSFAQAGMGLLMILGKSA